MFYVGYWQSDTIPSLFSGLWTSYIRKRAQHRQRIDLSFAYYTHVYIEIYQEHICFQKVEDLEDEFYYDSKDIKLSSRANLLEIDNRALKPAMWMKCSPNRKFWWVPFNWKFVFHWISSNHFLPRALFSLAYQFYSLI